MSIQSLRFARKDDAGFFQVLRQRVDQSLKEHQVSKSGGATIIFKSIVMLSLYLAPFVVLVTVSMSGLMQLFMCFLIGVGLAGVGMSVMHDANHGAFSKYGWVNRFFGGTLYILGGNVFGWKMQHNTLHHTYTNILHHDQDITGKPFLRLSYSDSLKKYHKYQHWYAPILYSMMTVAFFVKDFKQVFQFNKDNKKNFQKEFTTLLIGKVIYFSVILLMPMLVMDITIWQWLLGFMTAQLTAGLIMATVFQLAHVVEGAEFPESDTDGNLENTWAIHQLLTTANFGRRSKILAWYIGGLNFQIEHHLFPNICHVHYPKIAPIVEQTAKEYGIPYNEKKTFLHALNSHIVMLKHLGKNPEPIFAGA